MNKIIPLNKEIGQRLRKIRQELDLSQEAFCKKMPFDRSNFSRIEMGMIAVSSVMLAVVHNEFNVNLNYLITGEGEPFRDTD